MQQSKDDSLIYSTAYITYRRRFSAFIFRLSCSTSSMVSGKGCPSVSGININDNPDKVANIPNTKDGSGFQMFAWHGTKEAMFILYNWLTNILEGKSRSGFSLCRLISLSFIIIRIKQNFLMPPGKVTLLSGTCMERLWMVSSNCIKINNDFSGTLSVFLSKT